MTDDVRRHPDGSIDFDFYRVRATALRGQAMRDAASLRMASAGALVMVGALSFALVIPSAAAAVRGQMIAARSTPTQTH